jgi:hypothetical protein
MPNEVEITITAQDLSGPAFAGALAHLATLQAAAKMLATDIGRIGAARLDTGAMAASLVALKNKIQQLGIADIADVNVPYGRLITQINIIKRFVDQAGISDLLDVNVDPQKLQAQISKLKNLAETIPVNFDVAPLPASLIGKNLNENILVNIEGAQNASSALNNVGTAATAAMGAAGGAGNGGGGGSGILGAAAAGGYFGHIWSNVTGKLVTGGGWGTLIGGVGAWHLALDGAIEALISVGLAALAATAGVATIAETGKDLYQHLAAVDTVAGALGQDIPPLTGHLDQMAEAMKSQGIELYGAGLNIVSHSVANLFQVASPVVTLFDDWAAKLVIWENSMGGVGGILHSGIGYLQQFGSIIGTLGSALGNLLHEDPGIAHYLLDIIQGAATLLKLFTDLPAPIVAATLMLHGLYVWGQPLASMFVNAAKGMGGFIVSLSKMAYNPLFWVAAAAAGLAYLAYESGQATKSTKDLINGLNTGLQADTASQAIGQIAVDVGILDNAMAHTNVQETLQGWDKSWMALAYDTRAVGQDIKNGLSNIFTPGGSVLKGIGQLGDAIMGIFKPGQGAEIAVQNNIRALNGELQNLVGQQGDLFHMTGNLITQGYSYAQSMALMDLAGVKAGDSYQLMQQKVKDLITGYQDLSIRGGLLANSVNAVTFASLQQNEKVQQLNAGWDAFENMVQGGETEFFKFNNTIVNLNGTLGKSADAVQTLSSKQAQSIQYFTVAAGQANTEMDSLTTLANAAGLGAKGTDLLQQATKDMVASMLPAAAHSQTFTAILYALAQRGGYQGADSFKALSTWVGNTENPMKNLSTITGILTKASAGLTTDVKNLSIALGSTLNSAMATAIFDASGGQKIFDNFASAIFNTGLNSQTTQDASLKLANSLINLTGNASQAKSEFVSFAEDALHLTQSQADELWNTTLPKLQGAVNALHGTNIPITASFIAVGDATVKAEVQGKTWVSHLVGAHAANGMMVTGGVPGQDSVPIMAMPGEVVVPTSMVNAGAVDHLQGAIPGFGSGGLVGEIGNVMPWGGAASNRWGTQTSGLWATGVVNAFAADISAAKHAAQQLGITGGSTGGASQYAYERYAASLFPSHGWGGNQILPLGALWNRESGWNPLAMNASSGAFGIAQALGHGLPGTGGRYGNQYPSVAANNGNAAAQIQWGEDYIAGNPAYRDPAGAWAHELAYGWYGSGLDAIVNGPALLGVGERGAEHVTVTPAGQGGPSAAFEVSSSHGQELETLFKAVIKRIVIADGGGDVQQAFGRNW